MKNAEGSSPAPAAESWVKFRDPDGAFTIEFPQPPNVKNESESDLNVPLVEYSLELGGRTMAVIVPDYTSKPIMESKKVIDTTVGALSRSHTLQSDTVEFLDGRKGRSVTFKDDDGKPGYRSHLFCEGTPLSGLHLTRAAGA